MVCSHEEIIDPSCLLHRGKSKTALLRSLVALRDGLGVGFSAYNDLLKGVLWAKRPPPPWKALHRLQPVRALLVNRGKFFKQTAALLIKKGDLDGLLQIQKLFVGAPSRSASTRPVAAHFSAAGCLCLETPASGRDSGGGPNSGRCKPAQAV